VQQLTGAWMRQYTRKRTVSLFAVATLGVAHAVVGGLRVANGATAGVITGYGGECVDVAAASSADGTVARPTPAMARPPRNGPPRTDSPGSRPAPTNAWTRPDRVARTARRRRSGPAPVRPTGRGRCRPETRRPRPAGTNNLFLAWETLTHGEG
jgi:hypothetical protein